MKAEDGRQKTQDGKSRWPGFCLLSSVVGPPDLLDPGAFAADNGKNKTASERYTTRRRLENNQSSVGVSE
jgi:hypothetical protein